MSTSSQIPCDHCGADCGKHPVHWQDLHFCCQGCQTVYQLLNENKLYRYYKIEEQPGIKLETTTFGNKYEFLDKEEMKEKFTSFSEGGIAKVKFFIPVIHCASCIWLLENLHRLHGGIRHSFVNFSRKEVDITFALEEISLRQVVELLASIHYIPDLSQNPARMQDDRPSYKNLLYKMGVAGFVFINVMTYSLPAYFNGAPLNDRLQSLFSILSYVLVIPVVFFSGSDYFSSSVKSLAKKNISIDLPIALGITVLFGVTSYEVIWGHGTGYSDSLAGLIFFLLVGKWYQGKTYEALSFDRNYKSYFPIAVTKINKQVEESVLLEHITEGDELLIRSQELIPADSLLLEGQGRIDYSFVTGESTPVSKHQGELIYAGGRQMGELIRIRVKKKVSQSHLTQLWNQDRSYEKPSDSLKTLSDRISKYFTLTIIAIALGGFAWWMFRGQAREAIFVFTAVLIVACPCALALSIPFTLGSTMRIFGKQGMYIKNTGVIERLSRVDTLVFDKTGTLTRPNESRLSYEGAELTHEERTALYSLARQSTHPLSAALARHLEPCPYGAPEHFVEVAGRGIYGKVGALEIRLGALEYVSAQGEAGHGEPFPAAAGNETGGSSEVHIALDGSYKGRFILHNQYREGVEEVLHKLGEDFSLHLLSGDNAAEAPRLQPFFREGHMHFRQSPSDKADYIARLQKSGHRVLMTGDGLNDAGALMQSDVALTVANKVYHFSPASDAVLEAARFPKLAVFTRFSKQALLIVKIAFGISFLYNVVGISFALSAQLSPVVAAILMPLSSVSVVAFASFSTRLWARFRFGRIRADESA